MIIDQNTKHDQPILSVRNHVSPDANNQNPIVRQEHSFLQSYTEINKELKTNESPLKLKPSDSDLIKKPFPARAGNYDDPESE